MSHYILVLYIGWAHFEALSFDTDTNSSFTFLQRECQKADWKNHKPSCTTKKSGRP